MIHRSGYLCGVPSVELSIGFQQKIGAGLFGGEGFILQKIAGTGDAWVELDGEIVEYELAAGESLRVHPGHVGMFHAGVSFELDRIKGIKNIFFGDGLFLAKLTGPGHVWLQTLPLSKLAQSLIPYLPQAELGRQQVRLQHRLAPRRQLRGLRPSASAVNSSATRRVAASWRPRRQSRIGNTDCHRCSFSKLSVALTISSPSPASAYTWEKRGNAGPAMTL